MKDPYINSALYKCIINGINFRVFVLCIYFCEIRCLLLNGTQSSVLSFPNVLPNYIFTYNSKKYHVRIYRFSGTRRNQIYAMLNFFLKIFNNKHFSYVNMVTHRRLRTICLLYWRNFRCSVSCKIIFRSSIQRLRHQKDDIWDL